MTTFQYVANASHWSHTEDVGAWKRQPVRISSPVKHKVIRPH